MSYYDPFSYLNYMMSMVIVGGIIGVIIVIIIIIILMKAIRKNVKETETKKMNRTPFPNQPHYQAPQPIQQPSVYQASPSGSYCRYCGDKISDDATFCPKCGNKL